MCPKFTIFITKGALFILLNKYELSFYLCNINVSNKTKQKNPFQATGQNALYFNTVNGNSYSLDLIIFSLDSIAFITFIILLTTFQISVFQKLGISSCLLIWHDQNK